MDPKLKQRDDKERNLRRAQHNHLAAVLDVMLNDPDLQEKAEKIVERKKREREGMELKK